MTYFSRLTDIVTCNLTEILSEADDPQAALEEIIREMQEGLAGAKRSVATAQANVDRIRKELDEHQQQVDYWTGQAKQHLQQSDESQARLALVRKQEVVDLIAGLKQQLTAAEATRDHLHTTLRALEARLADAGRRQVELQEGETVPAAATTGTHAAAIDSERADAVEAELLALKQELGRTK